MLGYKNVDDGLTESAERKRVADLGEKYASEGGTKMRDLVELSIIGREGNGSEGMESKV